MYVIFATSEHLLSRMIRYCTGSTFSHVALYFPNTDLILQSSTKDGISLGVNIESTGLTAGLQNHTGVGLQTYASFQSQSVIVKKLQYVGPENEDDMLKRLESFVGEPYDIGALFFLGFTLLAHKFLKLSMPKKNLWRSTGTMMCTEFATDAVTGLEDSIITPQDFYEKMKTMPNWKEIV